MKIRALFTLLALLISAQAFAADIVVYTARNEELIKPLFDVYTKKTGVQVKYVTDKDNVLVERLKAEGANSPADILLTVDAGNLWDATRNGLFQQVNSPVLEKNIPTHYSDPNNHWFGLSVRARTIVYNKSKVNPAELTTYEALGDPKWKGRLCLRTSKKVYNQSLVGMLIQEHGVQKTEQIVRSWVNNLAATPFPNDNAVMDAVAAGQCDVGLVNTYYYGRMVEKKPELPLALFWPNQKGSGVHVNVSGAGVLKTSKNKAEAIKLLEWLSTPEAQNLFADVNMEYPANPNVKPDKVVASWGSFKENRLNVSNAGVQQAEAIRLMDRVGYK